MKKLKSREEEHTMKERKKPNAATDMRIHVM
jgi:hypothetical protein